MSVIANSAAPDVLPPDQLREYAELGERVLCAPNPSYQKGVAPDRDVLLSKGFTGLGFIKAACGTAQWAGDTNTVPEEIPGALSHFDRALQLWPGNDDARFKRAVMAIRFSRVEREEREALEIIKKTADKGVPQACFTFGLIWGAFDGYKHLPHLVSRNFALARKYFKQASDAGHSQAKELLIQIDILDACSGAQYVETAEDAFYQNIGRAFKKGQYDLAFALCDDFINYNATGGEGSILAAAELALISKNDPERAARYLLRSLASRVPDDIEDTFKHLFVRLVKQLRSFSKMKKTIALLNEKYSKVYADAT